MPLFVWRLQDTGMCISYTQWVSICMTWAFCDNHCCCCSLWRIWAIKMNDGDGFQSAGKAESCIAAESWRLQEEVVLVQPTGAWAALCCSSWSSALPQSGVRNRDTSPLLSPCLPQTAYSPDQSSLLSQTTDRSLKSKKQGWEVEDESTAGKNVIRQLEVSLGNKI